MSVWRITRERSTKNEKLVKKKTLYISDYWFIFKSTTSFSFFVERYLVTLLISLVIVNMFHQVPSPTSLSFNERLVYLRLGCLRPFQSRLQILFDVGTRGTHDRFNGALSLFRQCPHSSWKGVVRVWVLETVTYKQQSQV
jgi:hypothetical protein